MSSDRHDAARITARYLPLLVLIARGEVKPGTTIFTTNNLSPTTFIARLRDAVQAIKQNKYPFPEKDALLAHWTTLKMTPGDKQITFHSRSEETKQILTALPGLPPIPAGEFSLVQAAALLLSKGHIRGPIYISGLLSPAQTEELTTQHDIVLDVQGTTTIIL